MSVDWLDYRPDWPPFRGPLRSLSRKEARISFEHFMRERATRIAELQGLLARNGVVLEFDLPHLQAANSWFAENVDACEKDPEKLENLWYSVINDVSVFIGEMIILQHPVLRWEMFTWGKKHFSYQGPVIMGFDNMPGKRMNINISGALATYSYRLTHQLAEPPDYFVSLVDHATHLLQIKQE